MLVYVSHNWHQGCSLIWMHHQREHEGKPWQTQWLFGSHRDSVFPSCEWYRQRTERKRYRAKKMQSHFSSPCAPWVQTPSDSTFSIVTSATLIVCALWLQWMAGSPLNIINGSPLLYFAECSSALGHCNNLQKQRKGLGIYEMSPFQPSGRNTARCRCGRVLTRVNLSLLLL